MKAKNKVIAFVQIAIVLCSVFLVALPAIAAEQNQGMQKVSASEVTTASEDDYVLGIYGNANEDDTIDMRDLTYVKLIFFGKKPETELSDAKYDGKINPLDFIQIKLIIVGKEKELTLVDSADRIVTVKKPVERIVVCSPDIVEALKILGSTDKLVGVGDSVIKKSFYFPELRDTPIVCCGSKELNYEAAVAVDPDIVILYCTKYYLPYLLEVEEKLKPTDITVVGLNFFQQMTLKEEVEKLGYILGEEGKAIDYINWYKKYEDAVKDLVDDLKEEDKPRVLLESKCKDIGAISIYGPGSASHDLCTMAGGINIASDLGTAYPKVEWEWVLKENPAVIIRQARPGPTWGWDNVDEPAELIKGIKSRPGADSIAAVKNDKVYVYSTEILFGMDSVAGLNSWAKLLHPEFDLDPKGIYREYLEKYMKIDYPEDIIFVYPPLAG